MSAPSLSIQFYLTILPTCILSLGGMFTLLFGYFGTEKRGFYFGSMVTIIAAATMSLFIANPGSFLHGSVITSSFSVFASALVLGITIVLLFLFADDTYGERFFTKEPSSLLRLKFSC